MIENGKTIEKSKPETPPLAPSLDMGLGSREQYFRCRATSTTLRIVKTKIVSGTAA